MADDRSRLHEIVDQLPEQELGLACQILELLGRGKDGLPPAAANGHDDERESDQQQASPETLALLGQLTDDELLRLDDLLETDREAARQFWRERFGGELPDDELVQDAPD